jgi:diacylglycerol O-acyltransferase
MYRLHGQDASWLYRETLTTPMHTLKIFLVSLAPDQQLDYNAIKAAVPRLLHEVPMLRQRPVFVPLGLHHPVMIEDPEFDLRYHLNRAALPAPGGQAELEEVIAHIASHPLDQTRPLWQFWVLEGMADGRVALVQKIHHCLADGTASMNFINRVWHSAYHDPTLALPQWAPEKVPSRSRLLWDALVDHLRYDIANLPSFCRSMYRSTMALFKFAKAEQSPTLKSKKGEAPDTHWNHALSSRRSFALAQLPLSALKSVKEQLGGTLNDVLLAVVAGAVRNYLIRHDALPDDPMLVTIPVSRDVAGSKRESGNCTAIMLSMLHVHIEDPLERYQAIRASTLVGKSELELIGPETFSLMQHYVPPAIQQMIAERAYHKQLADAANYHAPANLFVSNVAGPRERFEALGNVVEELYSSGPLIDGIGLNITVWSYVDNMNFTLLGCMKSIPDISELARGLEPALAELQVISSIE